MTGNLNDWTWWQNALAGSRGELTRGDPKTGYYRDKRRAVAIWRDNSGDTLYCTVTSGYEPRHDDEIDELFGFCCRYPIPHEVYLAVERGESWPPEYLIDLTIKEIQAGETWSVEKARAKLARQNGLHAHGAVHGPTKAERAAAAAIVEPDAAENDQAVMGHNQPPEPMAPERDLAARIAALEKQAADWLGGIGGKPRDQIECDKVSNYRALFLRMEQEAETKRAAEKAPHLKACDDVDAKWMPLRDDAKELKGQLASIADRWLAAENAKLAEAARVENERRAKEAAAENERRSKALADLLAKSPSAPAALPADLTPVVVKPVAAAKATAGTMGRAIGAKAPRPQYEITDIAKVAAYLATLENGHNADFRECCQKLVNRLCRAGVDVPGVNEPQARQTAA